MSTSSKILVLLFHLALLCVPLFFTSVNEELFEFNKMILVYGFTVVIASVWLTKMVIAKKIIFRRTPFDIPLILFLVSQIISTIVSIHPRTSIFGYYTRFNGGLLSTLSYITLFYAFVSNITSKQAVSLLKTLIISGVLVSTYAFPEHFGVSPSCLLLTGQATTQCWVQDVQNRVFGTFGQPNWLAAFLIMVIPLAISFVVNKDFKKYIPYHLGVLALFTSVLVFTKSRSGLLALAVGLFIQFGAIALIISFIEKKLNRLLLLVLVVGSIALPILLTGTPFTKSALDQLKQTGAPAQQQITVGTQLESGGTESGAIRAIVWKGAINVFKRYPLFGSGVETFAYSYYLDRPVEHNMVSEWDFLYNKAHNEFLNYLATTGAFGFLTYLSLIITVCVFFTVQSFKRRSEGSTLFHIALLAGYIALLISNFFGFSTVFVSLLFFLFPAFSYVLSRKEIEKPQNNYSLTSLSYVYIGGIILVGGYLLIQVWLMWFADKTYAFAKKEESSTYLVEAYQDMKKATNMSPSEPTYHDELSQIAAKLSVSLATQNEATLAAQLAQEAVQESDTAITQNPVHLNLYKSRAKLFIYLAQLNPLALDEAVRTLEAAEKLSPTDPKLSYNIGVIKQNQNKLDEAESYLLKTISLKPNYVEARNALATLYTQKKDNAKAIEQLEYILQHVNPDDTKVKETLSTIKKQAK